MKALNKQAQDAISPDQSLAMLMEGNQRFVTKSQVNRDLIDQVKDTATGQYPHAVILSCIDSRVPAETVFDQGIGDIFSARVAGNFVNTDILGSIEYGCKVAGSKLVMVLGHTSCGAVKGACDNVQLGNITPMLGNLMAAVNMVTTDPGKDRNSSNKDFVNNVVKQNVLLTVDNIRARSSVLKDLEDLGEIKVVGAVYDVASGKVTLLD